MFPHQGGHGQLPTHWQPPTTQQPANGSYPPPPTHINSSHPPPPPPPQEARSDMAAHQQHPQQQQPYRLPGPHEWNRGPPPADPYRGQPPPPPQYMNHQPPAPRQRTAIACRYCRRRKIRCSGFEATDDGRCGNCVRFNQDCIFTPVSAQTQAFVPAHTVWRGVGQPPPMYGAYGQPLPPAGQAEGYGQQSQRQQGYLPSPTGGSPGPYQAHSAHGSSTGPLDEGGRESLNGRKRAYPEPHTPTLPPPNPGAASHLPHRAAGHEYSYPEPPLTSAASPATSATSYSSAPPPPGPQPYYAPPPPRRASPQSAYSYDTNRASSSPHAQAPPTPGATPYYPPPPQPNGALQHIPARNDGSTPPPPPPTSQPSSRPSMRINDLVSDNGPQRSSTDSNMLNMLNRRPM
ncbi:hypothetical protein DM02DRAFT_49144 [Periconia macrospinosa]|uniref:Zn(2)-C6 fungal-type domain-containing protein n=1 Tax=Periconia macrospinosa TaxID=97972 RepID=A0A2V1DJM4_9PLEO|nr:hypothetical protein DM02DRAFT_49144 [Periconia macrospinosa]